MNQPGDFYGTPFYPLRKEDLPDGKWRWRYGCINRGDDGRCSDYANRPWTCRHYQPGEDKLCALYKPCSRIWPPDEPPQHPKVWRSGWRDRHGLEQEA